jgi:poly(3-hydroxybutyrate) depolymerase/glycerophosphoryl diester phosphodiesterase
MTRHRPSFLLATLLLSAAACSDSGSNSADTTASATNNGAGTTGAAPSTTPATVRPATIGELLSIGRPIVLAHTGGEDAYPGSTLFAFGESVKAGVDMLDLNVQLTADGVLVVQHDDTVDRTTPGTGAVGDLRFAEVNALDAAYWFTTECGDCHDDPNADFLYRGIRTGARPAPSGYTADDFAIPSFEQLVARFPDLPLNIEIKGEGAPAKAAADELASLLTTLGRADASVVTSFQDDIVTYFHSLLPDVEVSPGLDATTAWVLGRTPLPDGMRILQLPPDYNGINVITPQLVTDSTAAGYPIWVWPNKRSLENLDSYRAFLAMGVVGLNINFPVDGVQAVEEFTTPPATGGGEGAAPSAGCQVTPALSPGDSASTLAAAGESGMYVRHLPPAYDGSNPLPLVVDLHGWAESAAIHVQFSGLAATGDARGFVTLTPDLDRPVPLWVTDLSGADLQWLGALLDEAEATLCIDTNRIYFAGMSNGAMMTSFVACALSDRVAAVATVAGVRDPSGCATARPVPLIAYLAYDGGDGPNVATLPAPSGVGTLGTAVLQSTDEPKAVPAMVAGWARRNGCAATEPTVTAIAADVSLSAWDCPTDAETVLYTVIGGGHSWPGSTVAALAEALVGHTTMNITANDLMWVFFERHPLGG